MRRILPIPLLKQVFVILAIFFLNPWRKKCRRTNKCRDILGKLCFNRVVVNPLRR